MEGESYAASRRRARTVAMQVLYEVDSVGHPWEVVSNRRLKDEGLPTEIASFARGLVEGALRNSAEIDGIISRLAPSWPMHQLPVVDRSLLRLAVFEMIVERLSPPKVVINETVELAKLFGGDNSAQVHQRGAGFRIERIELIVYEYTSVHRRFPIWQQFLREYRR